MKQRWYASFFPVSAKSIPWLSAITVFLIGSLTLVGWTLDIPLLKSIRPEWNSMKVVTAIGLILAAIALLFSQAAGPWLRRLGRIIGAFLCLVALLSIGTYAFVFFSGREPPWTSLPFLDPFLGPTDRMAVITAIIFFGLGCSLMLLGSRGRRAADAAHAVALPAAVLSYLVLVGYILNVPAIHEWLGVTVAFHADLALCLLCLGFFSSRTDTWLTRVFESREAGGTMARRLVPAILILPLIIGWLRLYGERENIFESSVGVALVAVTYTICFLSLVWLSSRSAIREQRQAEADLRQSHDDLEVRVQKRTSEVRAAAIYARSLIEAGLDPLVTISLDGKITDVNRATEEVTGLARDRLIGSDFSDYFTDPQKARTGYRAVLASGLLRDYPLTIRHASGRTTDVLYNATVYRNEAGRIQGVFAAARDVTDQKAAEKRDKFTGILLELFVRKASRKEYLDSVVEVLHQWSGCRCVGVRIADRRGHIPYESYVGFDRAFWEKENWLSLESDTCTCVRVVQGAPDPQDAAVMTAGGSFRCDDAAAFVGGLAPEEQGRFRGHCIRAGFKSLAVIPIRYHAETLGAIHLADEQEGKVPASAVQFIEAMTPLIGEALRRFDIEESVKAERQRLYDVLNTLPLYVILLSEDYHVPFANRFFEERFGESNGKRCYEYLFNRPEPCENCETYKVMKTGRPHHWEWTGPDKRNYDIHDFPFTDTDGSKLIMEMGMDVTERKKAEAVLQSASLYARSLIEASLDPLVTISADGKITDVNETTIKTTGVERERLIGTDFSSYFTEPDKAREGYQRVFAEGFVTDYPLTIRHKDGRLTDVLYNASVYKDSHGNVLGVFAAARDVTERKRAEQELAKYRDHLEDLVRQRTEELESVNRHLRQTAEELARSNQDLEQFAYVASHDLQEPLRIVAGYLQLLERRYKDKLDADANDFINFSVDGAARMQGLIHDLLAYSRVGTQMRAAAPTDMETALRKALANLKHAIEDSGAVVTHDPLPTVTADAPQMVQLFQNCIGNALKFRGAEPPRIHVGAKSEDGRWQFSVKDNGIGIDPRYADRIFVIFQRLHSRDKYPGTGIGLAICKRIVERHGGRIWVESQPGQESTFYFVI